MSYFIVYLIIAFVISVCLEVIIIPELIHISHKKKLFDEIDGRKLHSSWVSRLGGTTFTPIILFTICITMSISLYMDPNREIMQVFGIGIKQVFFEFAVLFPCLIVLYFIGIRDDLIGSGYKVKFFIQVLCSIFLVVSGVCINDFHGLFGFSHIPPEFGYPLTVLIIVLIINAINLIDGIDGLASGLSIIAFAILTYFYCEKGYLPFALIAISSLGCLCAFFYYNVFGKGNIRKRKIFMGDTGSLTIGMVLAYLLIRYVVQPVEPCPMLSCNPMIIFSIIIIPCFDAIIVPFGRIVRGMAPFKPDKTHLHHKFIGIGFSARLTLITILALSAAYIIMNFLLIHFIQITWILSIDIVLYLSLNLYLHYKLKMVEKQKKATESIIN